MLFIVLNGLWVVDTYDSYVTYPKEAFFNLAIGICITVIAYLIIQLKGKRITYDGPRIGKDNRVFINKMWRQREKIGNRLVVFSLVMLVIIFIFDSSMAFSLLQPTLFLGIVGFSFIYIMKDEGKDKEEKDIQPKSHKVRYLLRLVDYRKHPFSVPLIIFIMIVLTFLLSKYFGFVLNLETSGNPRYVLSLPVGARILAQFSFACGFIYIIQHCDFFGIRQEKQGDDKLMLIHFIEIIMCGSIFFIWLIILCEALFTSY